MERERKTVRFLRLINPNLKNLENWKSFAVPGSELKFLDRREKSLKKKEGRRERKNKNGGKIRRRVSACHWHASSADNEWKER